MRSRIGFPILVALFVTTLGLAAGCGDNDNSGSGGPNATRTATPARTATPGPQPTQTPTQGTTVNVSFNVTATSELDGFQFTATYPTAKGSFTGSTDAVSCTTAASGIFTKNDQDNGNLILSVANTSGVTFPVTITCTFDQVGGQTLAAGDIGITNKQASARGGGVGDPNNFSVAPSVS